MYALPTQNHRQRYLSDSKKSSVFTKIVNPVTHRQRIKQELKDLGASKAGLSSMEAHYLPNLIHVDEHIGGVIYGDHADGFVMLTATDCRVIFLDVKPFFINEDEINYGVVSGVRYGHIGFWTTITLHTRIRDYTIRTYNKKCALGFVKYIEKHIELRTLERDNREDNII